MLARSIVVVRLTSDVLPSLCAQPPATAAKAVADLTGQAAVVESMSTVLRIARDGSTVRTLEVKEHIQSDAGVRSEGIVSVPYASATQTVTFDYVRVRKASGETVETPGDGAQDTPLPVTQQAPMYSDLRYMQLPVRSLGTGDTLEYHITTKDTSSDTQGAMWNPTWFVTTMPVKQETVEVRAPRDFYLLVKSKKTQPTVSEESGERVYRWTHETASEYPKPTKKNTTAQVSVVQEMYEPDIAITSFRSWAEVGAWYRKLIAGRATPDAAIQAKADELTRGLPNDDAKVDAIYHYVATQYRYIAVSFGIGRLRPHEAAEIFRNQYGDCKDKHTLLEAMLKAAKIEAEPVLIGAGVRLNEALPMPSQFDHMITLVKLPGHDVWLDSTPEVAPARMLLTQLRDKLALAIPATGDAALVRTQATPPFPMYLHETVTGKLGDDGVLTAHFDQTMRGDLEVLYRSASRQSPRANWQALEQQISYSTGFAGDVSAVDASLPEKTDEPFHVSWDYTRKDFGDWPNRRFPGLTPLCELKLADDATAPERPLTLDSDMEMTVTAKLSLPPGYKLTPPADVRNSTPFAEYVSTYAVKDRTLTMERSLRYTKRELPVKDFAAFRDFAKAVGDDAGQMMQLIGLDAPEVKAAEGPAATGDATTDLIRRPTRSSKATTPRPPVRCWTRRRPRTTTRKDYG